MLSLSRDCSHDVLLCHDVLQSGFNSALTLQVNTTRQDVRNTKKRLNEEARQNREAQQSLLKWSADIEQERQLLFEAIAYLNDDVQSPIPDIAKIQLDLRRLKDFIAYKVDHAYEERDQYFLKSPLEKDNVRASFADSEIDLDTSRTSSVFYIHQQKEEEYRIKMKELNDEISDREVRVMLKTAEELKLNLEQSEAEAASLIGKIVAEKESLKVDRDALLIQLNSAMCTESSSQEMIKSLRKLLSEAHTEMICLNSVREKATLKELELTEGYEHATDQIFELTNELNKTNTLLSNSMRMTETLGTKFIDIENELQNEKLLREKDKLELKSSHEEIENLKVKLNEIKENEKLKLGEYVNKMKYLEKEISHIKMDNNSYQEETDILKEELLSFHENDEDQKEEINQLKNHVLDNEKNVEEMFFLAKKAEELKFQLNFAANSAKEAEIVATVRVDSCQKEIDRLKNELNNIIDELKLKESIILSLQSSIISLELTIKEESIKKTDIETKLKSNDFLMSKDNNNDNRKNNDNIIINNGNDNNNNNNSNNNDNNNKDNKNNNNDALINNNINNNEDLSLSLQKNIDLNNELIILKEKLLSEQIKFKLLEDSPKILLLKSKQIFEAIELSKITINKAAVQVDSVRSQVLNNERKIIRYELEIKNLKIEIRKIREREECLKKELNIANLKYENLNYKETKNENKTENKNENENENEMKNKNENEKVTNDKNNIISTLQLSLDNMKEELDRMEQLKDMAETKVAAMSLVGNGSRVLQAVEELNHRNIDYDNDDNYNDDNNNNNNNNNNNRNNENNKNNNYNNNNNYKNNYHNNNNNNNNNNRNSRNNNNYNNIDHNRNDSSNNNYRNNDNSSSSYNNNRNTDNSSNNNNNESSNEHNSIISSSSSILYRLPQLQQYEQQSTNSNFENFTDLMEPTGVRGKKDDSDRPSRSNSSSRDDTGDRENTNEYYDSKNNFKNKNNNGNYDNNYNNGDNNSNTNDYNSNNDNNHNHDNDYNKNNNNNNNMNKSNNDNNDNSQDDDDDDDDKAVALFRAAPMIHCPSPSKHGTARHVGHSNHINKNNINHNNNFNNSNSYNHNNNNSSNNNSSNNNSNNNNHINKNNCHDNNININNDNKNNNNDNDNSDKYNNNIDNKNDNNNHNYNVVNIKTETLQSKNNNIMVERSRNGGNNLDGMLGTSSHRSDFNRKPNISSPLKIISPNKSPKMMIKKNLNSTEKESERGRERGSLRSNINYHSPTRSSSIYNVEAYIDANRTNNSSKVGTDKKDDNDNNHTSWETVVRGSRSLGVMRKMSN